MIAMFAVSLLASSLCASMLGQLRFISGVERAPSVMESPNATIVPASAGARTSRLEIQYQFCDVIGSEIIGCPVMSPSLEIYAVRRAVACIVAGPVSLEKYRLIATSLSGGRFRSTRSEERRVGKECRSRWS